LRRLLPALAAAALLWPWQWLCGQLFLKDAYALDGKRAELTVTVTDYALSARALGTKARVYLSQSEDMLLPPGTVLRGEFLVKAGYVRDGIHLTLTQTGAIDTILPEKTPWRYLPAVMAERLRNRLRLLFPSTQAAFLDGLLTGNTRDFPNALYFDLYATGLTHIASVSGLHVVMLAGFITFFARNRKLALALTLPAILLYVAMAGFPVSAIRSAIMLTLSLASPVMGREYRPLRALLVAGALILLFQPYAARDLSFQLSFSSTLGLCLFRKGGKFAQTLSPLVFSTPIVAYSFGGVSLVSPLANLLLLPIINICFLLSPFTLFITPLAKALTLLLRFLFWAMRLLADIPYAVLYTSQIYLVAWLAFTYVIFLLCLAFKPKWKLPAGLAAGAFVLMLGITVWQNRALPLAVDVLNVGQGQCVVVRSKGEAAVIDCGGYRAGDTAVKFLQSAGVRNINAVILTGTENARTSGLYTLTRRLNCREVVYSPQERVIAVGAARLTVIPVEWAGKDHGLTVLIQYGGFSCLVTGPASAAGERYLTRAFALPRGGALIAGRHGGGDAVCEELLDAIRPQAVAVSSDKPASPQLRQRLALRGIELYSTAESGKMSMKVY
jgi:competence protein ComEC